MRKTAPFLEAAAAVSPLRTAPLGPPGFSTPRPLPCGRRADSPPLSQTSPVHPPDSAVAAHWQGLVPTLPNATPPSALSRRLSIEPERCDARQTTIPIVNQL